MIIFQPSTGKIPQFYDNNGELLANSISEKCYLKVNDVQLGMIDYFGKRYE